MPKLLLERIWCAPRCLRRFRCLLLFYQLIFRFLQSNWCQESALSVGANRAPNRLVQVLRTRLGGICLCLQAPAQNGVHVTVFILHHKLRLEFRLDLVSFEGDSVRTATVAAAPPRAIIDIADNLLIAYRLLERDREIERDRGRYIE